MGLVLICIHVNIFQRHFYMKKSGGIKRRVLKRQSTRGKKASRIKPKRQNGSKKRKGVKTRYVQGKKKKKKMNKKSSQKQNKK